MSTIDLDCALVVAEEASRLCYRRVLREDLEQEAWLAVLRSRRNFEPELAPTGGIRPYARLAARRALVRQLIRETSPVSACDGRRHRLIGLRPAALDEVPDERLVVGDRFIVERWRTRVVLRLRDVLGEERAEDVFHALDKPLCKLPMKVLDALAVLSQDEELRSLWEARP